MADYTLFVVYAVLLGSLITGASYMQQKHDADTMRGGEASQQMLPAPAAASSDTSIQLSAPVSPSIATSAPAVAPATTSVTPKPAPKPKPTILRVYNQERDDD